MSEDDLDKALKDRQPELRVRSARALDDARFVLQTLEHDHEMAEGLANHLKGAVSNQRDVVTRLERVLAPPPPDESTAPPWSSLRSIRDACCDNEDRDMNGGCKNCGSPCI